MNHVDREAVMKLYSELLAITKSCLVTAKDGEFLSLDRLMETRSSLIDKIQTIGVMDSCSCECRQDIFGIINEVQEMDKEISKVIKLEMSHNRHSVTSLLATRKVLSAYKGAIPKVISFDKVK